jgi:hypothetical protein
MAMLREQQITGWQLILPLYQLTAETLQDQDTAFTIAQPIAMLSAQNAYDTVLQWAGAVLPRRDTVDLRIINE